MTEVGFEPTPPNLSALMLVGNVCTSLLNCKPNINVKSSVAAIRLTLGDRSNASNRDLMLVGALYSFEKMLLLPRKILISIIYRFYLHV